MSFTYEYSLSSDFGGNYKNFQFLREVDYNNNIPDIRTVTKNGDTITFFFDVELSSGEQIILDAIVAAHNPINLSIIGDNLNQLNGGVAPVSTNDEVQGYSIGSLWRNTGDSNKLYICQDPTQNSAVWTPIVNYTRNYAESTAVSSTTGQGFKNKVSLSFTANSATYLLSWYAEIFSSDSTARVNLRIQQDQTTTLAETDSNPDTSSSTGYGSVSGFTEVTLSAGTVTFDMDYASTKGGKSVSIRRARLRAIQI